MPGTNVKGGEGVDISELFRYVFDSGEWGPDDPELELSIQVKEDRELADALLVSLRRKALVEALQEQLNKERKRHTEQIKVHEKDAEALRGEIAQLRAAKAGLEERLESTEQQLIGQQAAELANRSKIHANVARLIQQAAKYFGGGGQSNKATEIATLAMDPEYSGYFYPDPPAPAPNPKDSAQQTGSGRKTSRRRK